MVFNHHHCIDEQEIGETTIGHSFKHFVFVQVRFHIECARENERVSPLKRHHLKFKGNESSSNRQFSGGYSLVFGGVSQNHRILSI